VNDKLGRMVKDETVSYLKIAYCDGLGVSYATTSKVHVTSDVSVATQRLRILKQPNYLKPQQR
jgi:hypothetical protein